MTKRSRRIDHFGREIAEELTAAQPTDAAAMPELVSPDWAAVVRVAPDGRLAADHRSIRSGYQIRVRGYTRTHGWLLRQWVGGQPDRVAHVTDGSRRPRTKARRRW